MSSSLEQAISPVLLVSAFFDIGSKYKTHTTPPSLTRAWAEGRAASTAKDKEYMML